MPAWHDCVCGGGGGGGGGGRGDIGGDAGRCTARPGRGRGRGHSIVGCSSSCEAATNAGAAAAAAQGSAAEAAGIRQGDEVVAVDGRRVTSLSPYQVHLAGLNGLGCFLLTGATKRKRTWCCLSCRLSSQCQRHLVPCVPIHQSGYICALHFGTGHAEMCPELRSHTLVQALRQEEAGAYSSIFWVVTGVPTARSYLSWFCLQDRQI